MSFVTCLVLLAQLVTTQSAAAPLERIRAKIPVDLVTASGPAEIAGQYAHPSKELRKLLGPGLSGDNLYIFPDKTYIYVEWADISPNTVVDKGRWSFSGGILELKSDPDITWDTRLDRRFLAVRRPSHTKEILLLGIETEISSFEEEARNDPESTLLIVGKQRDATISPAAAGKLKAKLMREAWRPDPYQKKP
ncbi:MAG TPA: hypothetical protein VLY23_15570 [Candidatus Acidoferrum sp.]|nr:hypothetical protein [Candidatus Acidoferrum sp.]